MQKDILSKKLPYKTAEVTVLTPCKIDFKTKQNKNAPRNKKGHFMMIQDPIHQEI